MRRFCGETALATAPNGETLYSHILGSGCVDEVDSRIAAVAPTSEANAGLRSDFDNQVAATLIRCVERCHRIDAAWRRDRDIRTSLLDQLQQSGSRPRNGIPQFEVATTKDARFDGDVRAAGRNSRSDRRAASQIAGTFARPSTSDNAQRALARVGSMCAG